LEHIKAIEFKVNKGVAICPKEADKHSSILRGEMAKGTKRNNRKEGYYTFLHLHL